jgi:hypothetical protein
MNQGSIKYILSIIIGLMIGLFILTEVLTARTGIGQLYLYFAIASLIFGLSNPKKAMYALAFCTVYIDFFKRLMVIGGVPTFLEVSYILAIPPLLVAGSLISIVLSFIFSDQKISRDMIAAFIFASFIAFGSLIGIVLTSASTQGLSGVGVMINQGFYAYIIFIIPILFPSDEERRKFLHFMFCLIIPSLLYMYWQEYHGYAHFEYDYLNSGLSIEAKNLDESIGGELRKFSTFNGSGTAATIYSIYIVYCFVSLAPEEKKKSLMLRLVKLCWVPLLALAAYFTISRTGWFCGIGASLAFFFLGSRIRSVVGISLAFVIFAIVLAVAPLAIRQNWLVSMETELKSAATAFSDDPAVRRAIVLGTFGDRLQGWANLTQEPKLWTPFGFAAAGIDFKQSTNNDFRWGHDALIDSLIKFGYIPVFFALTLGLYLLYKLLHYMYTLPRQSMAFRITRLCLSLNTGLLVGGLSSAAQFRNFPQNVYFMLWIGIPFATYQQAMRIRKQTRSAAQSDVLPGDYPGLVNARSSLPAPR